MCIIVIDELSEVVVEDDVAVELGSVFSDYYTHIPLVSGDYLEVYDVGVDSIGESEVGGDSDVMSVCGIMDVCQSSLR